MPSNEDFERATYMPASVTERDQNAADARLYAMAGGAPMRVLCRFKKALYSTEETNVGGKRTALIIVWEFVAATPDQAMPIIMTGHRLVLEGGSEADRAAARDIWRYLSNKPFRAPPKTAWEALLRAPEELRVPGVTAVAVDPKARTVWAEEPASDQWLPPIRDRQGPTEH